MRAYLNGIPLDKNTGASPIQIAGVPVGTICAWSKPDIPEGWALCDGENGTPDLRDRFILGSGTKDIGETGGEEEVTLTIAQMPNHTHLTKIPDLNNSYDNPGIATGSIKQYKYSKTTTSHSAIDFSGESKPHNNMPPYYVLAFIMKVRDVPEANAPETVTTSIIDGWTVRKHLDGYVEMFYTQTLTIPTSWWTVWGSIYTVSAGKIPSIDYPIALVTKFHESANITPTVEAGWSLTVGTSSTNKTQKIGLIRGSTLGYDAPVAVSYAVFGLWK